MSQKKDCFEIGLAAGVIGGLIAGILFAPEEGSVSRQKVKNAIENFQEEHGDEIEDAKNQITRTFDLLMYNVERQFRKIVSHVRARRLRRAKELEDDYMFN